MRFYAFGRVLAASMRAAAEFETAMHNVNAVVNSRASRTVSTGEGRPACFGASRPPTTIADQGRPPETPPLEPDAGDQDLDEHLDGELVVNGSRCRLSGCGNSGARYRDNRPWCTTHYETGPAIVYLEARVR